MKTVQKHLIVVSIVFIQIFSSALVIAQSNEKNNSDEIKAEDKLVILWTSADKEVATKMVLMYASNSPRFEWWKEVTILVWGPSSKLLSEDEQLQKKVKSMIEKGIKFQACKGCADQYPGVTEKLESIGVPVKYIGGTLTNFIKEGRNILTL